MKNFFMLSIKTIEFLLDNNCEAILYSMASDPATGINIWKQGNNKSIKALSTRKIYPVVKVETKTNIFVGGLMHVCIQDCFAMESKLNTAIEKFEKTVAECTLNVNEGDENGMTALHHLCFYEYAREPYGLRDSLVAKLLELGANPNIKDIRGYTPLMCAIEKGYVVTHDPNDPRNITEKGIGKLLKVNHPNQSQKMLEKHRAKRRIAF